MNIKLEFAKREIGGESFLIPLGKTVYEYNGVFTLTEVGAFIWDILPEVETEEDILEKVLQEYDVDRDTAKQDISSFLNKLRNIGVI